MEFSWRAEVQGMVEKENPTNRIHNLQYVHVMARVSSLVSTGDPFSSEQGSMAVVHTI